MCILFHSHQVGAILDDISDHFPIFTIADIDFVNSNNPQIVYERRINSENLELFRSALQHESWLDVLTNADVNVAFSMFSKIFNRHLNMCLPFVARKKSHYHGGNEWMTPAIISSCRTKNRLYKKYLRSRTMNNLNEYKRFRNRLTSVIRAAKKSYYTNLFCDADHDTKRTWRSINSILYGRSVSHVPIEIKHNGEIVSNLVDVSNIFNEYFINIGTITQQKIPNVDSDFSTYMQSRVIDSIFISPVTCDEVLKIITSLKNSAAGFDGIPANIVKHVAHSLCIPLTYLCNLSIDQGIVPSSLKIARVVPVFKTGDEDSVNNYRPISILPCFSKVLEKILFSRIYAFLVKHNLIYDYQFGFLPGRSTTHAIVHFTNKVMEAFENNLFASGIFLDLSKAFDTLDHGILLSKLEHYGIRGTVLHWFKSYLSDRQQFVAINNVNSDTKPISCGVPQGSILGPLLFIIYVNDLHVASNTFHTISYADDTSLFFSSRDSTHLLNTIQDNFISIHNWFCANKLSLNVEKTTFIVFSSPSKRLNEDANSIQLCGENIIISSVTKFLGVYIDKHLSWNNHIQYIRTKVSKGAGILGKLRHVLPRRIMVTLYNTLILPYLSYCNVVWGSTYAARLQPLFILQKRAIRHICNVHYRFHTTTLFANLNVLSIYDLNRYCVAIFIFNWLNDISPSIFRNFFHFRSSTHSYPSRTLNNLSTPYFRLKSSQLTIRYVGIKIWNSLPSHVKNCKTIYTFKKHLKYFLVMNYH